MIEGVRHIISEAHELGDPLLYPAADLRSFCAPFAAMQTKHCLEIDRMVEEYRKLVMSRSAHRSVSSSVNLYLIPSIYWSSTQAITLYQFLLLMCQPLFDTTELRLQDHLFYKKRHADTHCKCCHIMIDKRISSLQKCSHACTVSFTQISSLPSLVVHRKVPRPYPVAGSEGDIYKEHCRLVCRGPHSRWDHNLFAFSYDSL